MAKGNGSTKAPATVSPIGKSAFGPLYKSFIARLKALGCIFCPVCYAYVAPEHAHVASDRKVA